MLAPFHAPTCRTATVSIIQPQFSCSWATCSGSASSTSSASSARSEDLSDLSPGLTWNQPNAGNNKQNRSNRSHENRKLAVDFLIIVFSFFFSKAPRFSSEVRLNPLVDYRCRTPPEQTRGGSAAPSDHVGPGGLMGN